MSWISSQSYPDFDGFFNHYSLVEDTEFINLTQDACDVISWAKSSNINRSIYIQAQIKIDTHETKDCCDLPLSKVERNVI